MGHHAEDFRTTLFFYTFVEFRAVRAFNKTLFVELFHDGVEELVLETRGEFGEGERSSGALELLAEDFDGLEAALV